MTLNVSDQYVLHMIASNYNPISMHCIHGALTGSLCLTRLNALSFLSSPAIHLQSKENASISLMNDQSLRVISKKTSVSSYYLQTYPGLFHASKITSKAYKILGLLRCTFCSTNNVPTKKRLYISLVRSQLLYGSQIWRPLQLKDTKPIKSLQRRATKYILNDYTSEYRSRLIKLPDQLLPLSMLLGLNDNMCFFVKSLKLILDNNSFDISKYIKFNHNQTRSGSYKKLVQPLVENNRDKQFYFNRLPYLWNSLPPIDLSVSFTTIKRKLTDIFWNSFLANFSTDNNCTYYYKCPCPSCFTHPKSCFTSL